MDNFQLSPQSASVIVVGKDEESQLKPCLTSLLEQKYPEFEVIYVDGGSKDSSLGVVESIAKKTNRLRVISIMGNISDARNAGIKMSTGKLIAFTDADCVASPNWLFGLASVLQYSSKDVAGVGGPNIPSLEGRSLRLKVIDQVLSTPLGSGGSVQGKLGGPVGEVRALSTSNCVLWKERVIQAGCFDSRMRYCEDSELSYRLRKLGLRLIYTPSFPVRHERDYHDVGSYASFIYRYGRGRGEAVRLHPHLITIPLICSFLLLAALVLTSMLSLILPWSRAGLTLLLGCYFAAVTFAGAIISKRLARVKTLVLTSSIFLITHIGYTSGFMHGWLFPKPRLTMNP